MNETLSLRRTAACILLALGCTALSVPALASSNNTHTATSSKSDSTVDTQATPNGNAAQAGATTNKKSKKKPVALQAVTVTASRISGISDQSLVSPEVNVPSIVLHPDTTQNIGLAINKLPMFAAGVTPWGASRSTGAGSTGLNLRGLGGAETLVLLNKQRFIGGLNSIPSILVSNVQVVTGGASAAWGSGAVAGVVNIQLDSSYTGAEARLTRGISDYGNGQETKFEFKIGSSFAGHDGHFILGGTVANNLGIGDYGDTTGFVTPLSIGGGKLQQFEHVVLNYEAIGGVINSGVLQGMVFNPDGTLRPFNKGTVHPPGSIFQVGGDGYFFVGVNNPLITPYKHNNLLMRVTYDLDNNVQAYIQGQYAKRWTNAPWLSAATDDITININNAFLPAPVKAAMQRAGETSFTMGRANLDFDPPETLKASNKTYQLTAGLKGSVANSDWRWNVYGSYGKAKFPQIIQNELSTTNFANAVNAVIDPTTQQPVCAVALKDPDTDCIPINLFGRGAPSPAAVQYVTNNSAIFQASELEVFSASLTGSPVSLPAGPLRVATGVDWRDVSLNESVGVHDIIGDTTPFVFTPLNGRFHVKEWFGEVRAPLLQDVPGFEDLSIDTAARYSDYSTAGKIWSFKGGFNDMITDGLRFRGSWSQDIRAPGIGELFSAQNLEINVVSNPFTGGAINNIRQLNGGNPNLQAEKAHTITGGLVFTPDGVPGFTASLEYFNIKVKDEIASPEVQFVINHCFAGVASACALVTFGPGKTITQVVTTDQNFASERNEGGDVDFSYVRRTTVFGTSGTLHARLMGTYTYKASQENNGITTDILASFAGRGAPRWMGFGGAGFTSKRFSVFTKLRLIGPYKIDRHEVIVNNDVSSRVYVDVGARMALNSNGSLQLGLAVNNVTNLTPNVQTSNIYYMSPMPRYYMMSLTVKL